MNHASTGSLRKKIILLGLAVLVLWFAYAILHRSASAPGTGSAPVKNSTSGFNKNAYSTTSTDSLWIIVNKKHPLIPKTYKPELTVPNVALKGSNSAENMHVSTQMASALVSLFKGAQDAGYPLMLSSGYRSYEYQVTVYNRIVHSKGEDKADQESARPGYSEHQTGLSADVAPESGKCDLAQCFGATPEGKWLAANAYHYGFIIRYPADKETVTGYEYEPWHVRYVGVDAATQMHNQHVETLEEFFNVSGGTSYN